MADIKPGDTVIIDRGLVATIQHYDEKANWMVYSQALAGGGTNVTSGHISNTNVQKIGDIVSDADEDAIAEAFDLTPAPADSPTSFPVEEAADTEDAE